MTKLDTRNATAVASDAEAVQPEAELIRLTDHGQASRKTCGAINAFPSEAGIPPFITVFPGDVGS